MKVLVTGAKGFVGKNLVFMLQRLEGIEVLSFDIDTDPELLNAYATEAEFVFHLAGVNRPQTTEEFMTGNFGFTSTLLDALKATNNKAPILITSSIQAAQDNPYGKSKKAGEELIFAYGKDNDTPVYIYRMPNVFGKWCRPNYNSAVATFCHNIALNLPITISNPANELKLVYIDDVVQELINAMGGQANKKDEFCYIEPIHHKTLGQIVELIESFKSSRDDRSIPNMGDSFVKSLYATYLSYLPEDQFSYPLKMNVDARGSFTEFIRTPERGQISVNISKPGITKGNHWHNTKNEKFLVVSGNGVIRFRKPDEEKVIEYFVNDKKLEVVDIPPGYTHNIENIGDTDMVTIMWCNECFDPMRPDTYYLEV